MSFEEPNDFENPNLENPKPENPKDAYIWGALCHLASLVGILLAFVGLPIPFANLLGPLIVWLVKREQYSFVDVHGKESLNFQISLTIYGIVSFLAFLVVGLIYLLAIGGVAAVANDQAIGGLIVSGGLLFFVAVSFLAVLGVLTTVFVIVAAVKANNGQVYRYPFTIRLMR